MQIMYGCGQKAIRGGMLSRLEKGEREPANRGPNNDKGRGGGEGGLPGLQMKTEAKRWTGRQRKLIFVDDYREVNNVDVYISRSNSINCEILNSVSCKAFRFRTGAATYSGHLNSWSFLSRWAHSINIHRLTYTSVCVLSCMPH